MKRRIAQSLLTLSLTATLLAPVAAQPAGLNLPATVPDLSQTDPGFAGGGDQYCAPVAVSNSLWWLSKNGYPQLSAATQVKMAQKLAKLMSTGGTGTGPIELMAGLKAFLAEAGLTGKFVHKGWRQAQPTEIGETFLLTSLNASGGCWINLGWYMPEGANYKRGGGHWVTLVGAKRGPKGLTLQVHDPSPRTGGTDRTETYVLEKLSAGKITGENKGLPRNAAGMYRVTSGVALKNTRYTTALIDSAVYLKL